MKAALLAAMAFCSGGCIAIPLVPHYRHEVPSRENMDVPLQEKFPRRGTSREAVLSRLGAPDETWGESRVVYRWRKVVGEVGFLGANRTSPIVANYALEIEFNGQGEVTLVRLK